MGFNSAFKRLTHLFTDAGIEIRRIVWVTTNSCFMSGMFHIEKKQENTGALSNGARIFSP
jgi:hypothetical protein